MIVVPASLFNLSSDGRNICRLVLNGAAEDAGINGNLLHEAKVGCQCALTGAIFAGFSWSVSPLTLLIQGYCGSSVSYWSL